MNDGDGLDLTIFGDDVQETEPETDETTTALASSSSTLASTSVTTTADASTTTSTAAASTATSMSETTSGVLKPGKWPLARPKRKSTRYQHITHRNPGEIEDNDRTIRCGRIRKQEKFFWLETRPQISVYCHPIQGRLQICDFVCSTTGKPPKTGPKHIKCYFFRDRVARLTNIKTVPQC